MRLIYFARVRETVGLDNEERELPADLVTVADAVTWLSGQGVQYAEAFCDPARLRYALDQKLVTAGAPLLGALELAIFPPVTGGC